MLQQTGVERVRVMYPAFLARFPSVRALAGAQVRDVLAAWKGLGYNRRALHLKQAAEAIVERHGGRVPRSMEQLMALPGVGRATACAVLAYAFNLPVAFIETNIRRVHIHFFFPGGGPVSDGELLPIVERTLDRKNPRDWYDALMDYGTALRTSGEDPNRRSTRYRRQAPFEGSVRQARGRVLAALLKRNGLGYNALEQETGVRDERLAVALAQLEQEGFILRQGKAHSARGEAGWRITPGSRPGSRERAAVKGPSRR